MRRLIPGIVAGALVFLQSCGPSAETGKPAAVSSRESLYREGHGYYVERNLDSAAAVLRRALALDSMYVPALTELADVQYELAMRITGQDDPERLGLLRSARVCLVRLESLGNGESSLYERLCELSVTLSDNRAFLKYARRNAEKYPFDRQMYNLGLAYYQTADYPSSVKVLKDAAEKFKLSPYVGGFYRTMGLAYMRQDRDQTATRMLETGMQAVDSRISDLKKAGTAPSSPDFRRLADDRVAMLVTLRKLYTTYKEHQKLDRVERLLREAGQIQ